VNVIITNHAIERFQKRSNKKELKFTTAESALLNLFFYSIEEGRLHGNYGDVKSRRSRDGRWRFLYKTKNSPKTYVVLTCVRITNRNFITRRPHRKHW
jgi:hypothetical protein